MSGVSLYIEGVKIDLSDKEGINIKLNTQDINDISKVNAGYSKDFSVMASKVNNKFFKHYYNADITGGFDARTKKSATIYLDDLFFISGKIRLTSTSLENNLIVSYRIQFEGDVVNVKDLLGDRKLKDLDLSEFDHEYNSNNVLEGLTTTNFKDGSVVYPLISSINRWVFDSSDAFENTETTKNIHFNSEEGFQAINYNELKPAVRLSDIVNKIQADNNINFVGDFFNRDYYKGLYLWYSNKEGQIVLRDESERTLIDFIAGDGYIDITTDTLNTDNFINTPDFQGIRIRPRVVPEVGYENVSFNFVVTLDNEEVYRQDGNTGEGLLERYTYLPEQGSGLLRFYIESSELFSYTCELLQDVVLLFPLGVKKNNTGLINLVGNVVIKNQAPDIKQIDLITGLLKMFNIALTAQIDGSILWETLPEFYQNGKEFKDFEQYIELDKTTIKRGKLINEFKFQYEEPQTILNINYAKNNPNNQDPYGDYTKELREDPNDPTSELLDGGKLEIKLPFEQINYERLRDLADNKNVSFQYGLSVDESLSPTLPKALLFYNVPNQSPIIGFKEDDGAITALLNQLNTPNQCLSLTDNTEQTICFNADLSTYNFTTMTRSLYNSFYSDYVGDIFSPQRRVYNFDAVIPNFVLAQINLNDRLIIGNRRYIINSINSNLTTQKTKLELLNDIYEAGDLLKAQFYAVPNFFTTSSLEEDIQSTIYTNKETTLTLVDEGNGIFASIVGATTINSVTTKDFIVEVNNTGLPRVMSVLCDNGTETFKIVILQDGSSTGGTTFDTTEITFDNTNITFDNE